MGASGDSLPLIKTYSVTNVPSITISDFVDSAYIEYIIKVHLRSNSDDRIFFLRSDSDGGASPDDASGAYAFITRGFDNTSTALTYSSTTSAIGVAMGLTDNDIGNKVGNVTGEGLHGTIVVEHVGGGSFDPIFRWDMTYVTSNSNLARVYGGGRRKATAAINALQIYAEGAPTILVSGEVRVYGVRNEN